MKIKELAIRCLLNLDSVALSELLNDDDTYLNFSKFQFVKYLSVCFQEFFSSGDASLYQEKGRCEHAIDGNSYIFIGNESGKYVEVLIFENDEKHLSIQECYCFNNNPIGVMVNSRIYIDPNQSNPF